MTKSLAWVALPLLAVLAAPHAAAQMPDVPWPLPDVDPVPDPREIEVLAWADDEWEGFRNQPSPVDPFDEGALDLRGMYYREAYLPGTSRPAFVIRLLYEESAQHVARDIGLSLSVGDTAVTRSIATADGRAYSSDLDRLDGPFKLDERFCAFDLWLAYDSLGVGVGDQLTDIVFMSNVNGAPADAMPGGWYFLGTEMQWMTVHWPPGGAWTLKGPQALLEATASTDGGTATLRIANPLQSLPQTVGYRVTGTTGAPVQGEATLAAGESIEVPFTLPDGANATQLFDLVAWSDLGARSAAAFALTGPAPAVAPGATAPADGMHDDEHVHTTADAPAASLVGALAALALAAVAVRRR